MLPKTKTERHADICKEINALYAMKNHDYGDSFHQTFTEEGMAMPRIRLGDKLARFKSLTKSGVQEVKDESIRDTLIDLANYAIMTVLEMEVVGNETDYVAQTATGLGVSLADVAQHNIDKLRDRYPDGFDPERSVHRPEYEEGVCHD